MNEKPIASDAHIARLAKVNQKSLWGKWTIFKFKLKTTNKWKNKKLHDQQNTKCKMSLEKKTRWWSESHYRHH